MTILLGVVIFTGWVAAWFLAGYIALGTCWALYNFPGYRTFLRTGMMYPESSVIEGLFGGHSPMVEMHRFCAAIWPLVLAQVFGELALVLLTLALGIVLTAVCEVCSLMSRLLRLAH